MLDLSPVVTPRVDGAPGASAAGSYDASRPEFGGNVRWGVTSNLTLNGTVNPDFSQVESDAGQFQFDPRQALYFPEKRPFFLDGLEQFTTPNNLIYTRRIVAPVGGGEAHRQGAGHQRRVLSRPWTTPRRRRRAGPPVFNILRVQRDVGGESKAAFVYTDRVDGANSNRVAAADARFTFGGIYALNLQAGLSRTVRPGGTATAPIWQATLGRTGRHYGFRYSLRGVADDFRAEAGFISRPGRRQHRTSRNQVTAYGGQGSVMERWTGDVVLDGTWQYQDFVHRRPSQDNKLHVNSNFTFRGGWQAGQSVLFETFGYDQRAVRRLRAAEARPERRARSCRSSASRGCRISTTCCR